MSKMFVLPGALRPEDGESLAGLVVRNASRFSLPDPRQLLSRIVKPAGSLLWTVCDADPAGKFGIELRTLLAMDEATFRRMSSWTGDVTTQSVLGHPVWRDLARPNERSACPGCMRQSPFHRAVWNLDAMPVCAVHGTWLRRECHGCGAPLTWSTMDVGRCSRFPNCDAKVCDAPDELADGKPLGGIRALHAIFTGAADAPAMPPAFEPQDALKLSFVLGQIAFGHESHARPRGFIERQRQMLPEILDAGWSALDDWPRGFHRLLDRLRERASTRTGKDGLRKAFGTLSSRVYRWAREPRGAAVGEAFAAYVAEQGDLATTSRTVARYAPCAEIRHRFITMKEAQKILGVSGMTIDRMAERRGLYVLPPRGAGLPALMRADVFLALKEEFKDFLLPEEARRELGVGHVIMVQLEAAGLIARLPASELVLEIKPFRRSAIRAFVDACIGKAPGISAEAGRKLSTVVSPTAPGRTVPDICRALMDGRLKPAGVVRGEPGLAGIRLSLAKVDAALPSSKKTLSLLDAAKQIKLKYPPVHFWVKRGLLQATSSDDMGEHGMRITVDEWARFTKDYVTSGMIATELGQGSNTWVARHLGFLGVKPVSGEEIDGGYANLFRRADVGPEVMEQIRRIQGGKPGKNPQDKHRDSFSKVAAVVGKVAGLWGATFTRRHNVFIDGANGRALRVVTGRRPDMTGVFTFHAKTEAPAVTAGYGDLWFALVPNEGEEFLLLPREEAAWHGPPHPGTQWLNLRFDSRGRPLEHTGRAHAVPSEVEQVVRNKPDASPRRPPGFAAVVGARISKEWGVPLRRVASQFTEDGGPRVVQVATGRPQGGPHRQFFVIGRKSFDVLSAAVEPWVALVPAGHDGHILVRLSALKWRAYADVSVQASVDIDGDGKPMGL